MRKTLRRVYRSLLSRPREAVAAEPTAAVAARILGQHSITVIDVGARGGTDNAWYRLDPLARLVGFEPDGDECQRLAERIASPAAERYVAVGLGKHSGRAAFYRTRQPMCSSLYRPDPEMPGRYPVLEAMRQVAADSMSVTTLADWAQGEDVSDIRFLKLDTQGSELAILQGADRVLDGCLGVEIEVEFAPLYVGQPLFADVDTHLRQKNFALWRLGNLTHYSETPAAQRLHGREHSFYDGLQVTAAAGNGRLMWGDAIYFRDYRSLADPRLLLILAALLDAAGDRDGARASLQRSLAVPTTFKPADRERLSAHLERLNHGPARGLNHENA